ncbi:GNAT family protein [Chitinivorax sp. B]|uniref:GNAT family N-acetyltransferase n=1 Tax=Chitinivorax sp. B TaxID=2502235 RepID=UPI0010F45F7E|nr:GNAT family protein [Chitinivorax sp. B]
MHIAGSRIFLRAVEQRDLPQLHRWANDPVIWQQLGGWHFPYSETDQHHWFTSLSSHSPNQRWCIDDLERGLIGTASLTEINWKDRNAFVGLLIGQTELRGQGYGEETLRTLMRHAFDELGLHRLESTIIEYNAPSLKLFTDKCGWQVEGRQRQWYYRQGQRWDRIWVGITADDYRQAG